MNCQIRVRKYGNEWVAWWAYYQGEILPLAADLPNREILPPKEDEVFHKQTDRKAFMEELFGRALAGGEIHVPSKTFDHGHIKFVQKQQDIKVTSVIIESLFGSVWSSPVEYCLDSKTGRFCMMTGMIKPGLPESMEADDVG